MLENISQNPWLYTIGILSGIIVIKNAWVEVLIPVAKILGIEINSKQHKEIVDINKKLDSITERLDSAEKLRKEGRELQQIILEGVTASLKGLQELKCNGPVTSALENLEDYKNHKAVS